jgi:hypothetical protein
MRTNELSGAALDWAVAKCEKPEWLGNQAEVYVLKAGFHPSTDWALGGAIIEREGIAVWQFDDVTWRAMGKDTVPDPIEGATPLIAAMRCYVASKLGDEVELPEGVR